MIKYRIAELAQRRGLSARGLASIAKISPNTVARLIKAKSPYECDISAKTVDRLCQALGCTPNDILKFNKGKEPI